MAEQAHKKHRDPRVHDKLVPWKAGQSGNPAGRPKGSKSQFAECFWRDIHAAWAANGASVLDKMIRDDPAKFLAAAVAVMPKDIEVTATQFVVVVPAVAETAEEWLVQQKPVSLSGSAAAAQIAYGVKRQ